MRAIAADDTTGMDRKTFVRARDDIVDAVERYADTVMRACAVHLAQQADREDAFQDTFLRYAQHEAPFAEEEHRKAWLIRVAVNVCKDQLKRAESRNRSLDEMAGTDIEPQVAAPESDGAQRHAEARELTEALQRIDGKYRTVLYMKYYEGYTAAQIADMTGMPVNTVHTNLARGRKALREVLEHGSGA